ncbi:MAG: TMEM165/GDT1 family protein [Candidatus Aquicultorales bacterium]
MSLQAFATSLLFITLAEMGDKTQLLALSFATKYKATKVLLGVFVATLVVHLFSVAVGGTVGKVMPMGYLKVLIGLSFLGFAAWTLRGDALDEDERKGRFAFGAVMTVAIAFFIAELGDKTQLATISLAAQYRSFVPVWIGSTLGMVVADGIAIIVGVLAGKRIPERAVKFVSAAIFAFFGAITIIQGIRVL